MSYHMANDKNKEENKMAYVCEWVSENEKKGYMIPGCKVVLISDYIDGNTVRWKACYPLNLSEELVQELREAMKVYKSFGSPIPSLATVDVVIDF